MNLEAALAHTDHLLPRLSELLAREMGLHFPPERWPDLMRGMDAVARDFLFKDVDACMQWLLSSPLSRRQIEIMASYLTVGETYFFRDQYVFDVLQTQILPQLIESRRQTDKRLRIWSAGCSSGEEAYSIAILLQRMIPDYQRWNITILATDINPQALRKAGAGIYNDWSFRSPPSWLRETYFRKSQAGQYELVPQVREMVVFSYLNLAEDVYPAFSTNTNAMDIIFCRNVLMYFKPRLAGEIISKQHRSLVGGGWLIVSPAESSLVSAEGFAAVNFPGLTLHRKTERAADPKPAVEPVAWDSGQKTSVDAGYQPTTTKPRPAPAVKKAAHPQPSYQDVFALYLQGQFSAARQAAASRLAMHPNDARTMYLMVRIHANQGELPMAQKWGESAVDAHRLDPVGYYLLAVIYQEQGQFDKAVHTLRRALYLDHDFVLAHFALGNLYRRHGRKKEAAKYFENALQLLGNCPQDEVLAESEGMTAGRLKEIIQAFANGKQAA